MIGLRLCRSAAVSGFLRVASLLLAPLAGCDDDRVPPSALEQVIAALDMPAARPPLAAEVLEISSRRRIVTERVRFQGRRGEFVPAIICYSEMLRTHPLPVILCMPGSPNRKEDLLRPLDLLPRWADQGFFVISIDRPYHGERTGNANTAIREKGLARVWGEYVYDLTRALDYAATRDEADPTRIGMLGLSMGGMEALVMAAIDERVGVVVSVSGHLSWSEVFRDGSWRLIFSGMELTGQLTRAGASPEQVHAAFLERFPALGVVDASLLAPLLAARPLLLMTGMDDPYATPISSRRTYEAALGVYRELGQEERLQLWIEPGMGHGFSKAMQARALAWFQRWL